MKHLRWQADAQDAHVQAAHVASEATASQKALNHLRGALRKAKAHPVPPPRGHELEKGAVEAAWKAKDCLQ